MARKITEEDIININNLYLKIGTYSGVAAELGFAPSTVKKYIIADYKPQAEIQYKTFDPSELPEFSTEMFDQVDDFGDLCEHTETEIQEIKELWNELVI